LSYDLPRPFVVEQVIEQHDFAATLHQASISIIKIFDHKDFGFDPVFGVATCSQGAQHNPDGVRACPGN